MAKTLKEILIARLEEDIVTHEEEYKLGHKNLLDAIQNPKDLSDEEIESEVTTAVGEVRYLSQFTSVKKVRDAAKERMAEKGGEIEPGKK